MADFVEVLVTATGNREQVPAHWIGDPVLGNGIELVDPSSDPVVEEAPTGPSDVQLTGPVEDLPIIPAVREVVLAQRAAAAKPKAKKATKNTGGTEPTDETPANGDKE